MQIQSLKILLKWKAVFFCGFGQDTWESWQFILICDVRTSKLVGICLIHHRLISKSSKLSNKTYYLPSRMIQRSICWSDAPISTITSFVCVCFLQIPAGQIICFRCDTALIKVWLGWGNKTNLIRFIERSWCSFQLLLHKGLRLGDLRHHGDNNSHVVKVMKWPKLWVK